MSKSVGLEIHARGVRAVEVSGKGKAFRVLRYLERPVTPRGGAPDPEELQEALTEVFKQFGKNSVVTSLPTEETVVREIPVPFKNEDQIRKVIKFEAEHHLHDCDADDVVVQYIHIGESTEGSNLLVFAARKEQIRRRVEACRGVGVEPLAMDLDAFALYNSVRAAGALDEVPNCVLLNIAHKSTDLVFLQDGEIRAVRSVRLGVDGIVHGLARDMDVEFAEADSKLVELGGLDEPADLLIPEGEQDDKPETHKSSAELEHDLFVTKRDDFLARLKREYVRSSAAMRGNRPDKIIATGPGLAVAGLVELLSKRLGLDIDVFTPSTHFKTKLKSPAMFDATSAIALGLALKGQRDDPLDVDFRQEELRVANKFELLKVPLAVTVTLAFLALTAFSFFNYYKRETLLANRYDELVLKAYQSFSQVTQKYNELSEEHVKASERVDPSVVELDGPKPEAIKRFVRRLNRMRTKLTRIAGSEEGITPITSALKLWNDIFGVIRKMHEELEYVDFERIEIRQDAVQLTVIVPSVDAIESMRDPISKLDSMKGMEFNERLNITPMTDSNRQKTTLEWVRPKRSRRGR
ncbi:MAG: pilus assembly protein PilM [Planctomycetota bacterium]|jgi:type IV pilus assembly protein PilM